MNSKSNHRGADLDRYDLPPATMDGERLIAVFSQLIEPLGRTLPISSEIILHDFSKMPNSIVAIYGNVTGRKVGDPATNYLLERVSEGRFENDIGYETSLPDGRRLKSSTMIIRDISNSPVAALCINSDVSVWVDLQSIASAMIRGSESVQPSVSPGARVARTLSSHQSDLSREWFPKNVDELAEYLIRRAVDDLGISVSEMKKKDKVQVVGYLKNKGFFLLKDAIEMIATELKITRFTIYNYLNELEEGEVATPKP